MISRHLMRLLSLESVMPSNHVILCRPFLLLSSVFPSVRVFSNKSAVCIKWPKYWSFSFSISPSVNIQDWLPLGWTGWIALLHLLSLQTPPRTQVPAGEHRGLALCALTEWPMRLHTGRGGVLVISIWCAARITPRSSGQTGNSNLVLSPESDQTREPQSCWHGRLWSGSRG